MKYKVRKKEKLVTRKKLSWNGRKIKYRKKKKSLERKMKYEEKNSEALIINTETNAKILSW